MYMCVGTTHPSRCLALGILLVSAAAAPRLEAQAPPPVVDPSFRLLDGSSAGEAYDVAADLGGGNRLFARFWVTNEGPGSHTGVAMGSVMTADGGIREFKYGRERERWHLGAAGRYVQIASAVLDLRPPYGRVEIDTNKYGIKLYARFAMPAAPPALCAQRTGGAGFDVLRLAEPLEGVAWVEGMGPPLAIDGSVTITHAWNARSEIDAVHRRVDAFARDGDLAFFASVVTAPDGAEEACVAVTGAGADRVAVDGVKVAAERAALAGTDGNYPIPAALRFQASGIDLRIAPREQLLRIDPLDVVPQPFRTILGLRSKPRRAWAAANWELRLGGTAGEPVVERAGARAVTAVTFTNPWSR